MVVWAIPCQATTPTLSAYVHVECSTSENELGASSRRAIAYLPFPLLG